MLTINIAKHFPNTMVYGNDIEEKAIAKAKENKKKENISNVEFDWIVMVDFLHDLPNPDPCFMFLVHFVIYHVACLLNQL
jgi:methylase of polypeptide subunit release factors